jgi:hypothetical protein
MKKFLLISISLMIGLFSFSQVTRTNIDTISTGTTGFYNGQNTTSSAATGFPLKKNLDYLMANDELLNARGTTYTAYSSGTVYSLTGTSALLDFGTTDPSITIATAGKYLIFTKANYKLTGATFAGTQTITTKLRRTNNTAADLTNASDVITLPIVTTTTNHAGSSAFPVIVYTATAGDIIQVWGVLSATPSAGSVDCTNVSIVAVKIGE